MYYFAKNIIFRVFYENENNIPQFKQFLKIPSLHKNSQRLYFRQQLFAYNANENENVTMTVKKNFNEQYVHKLISSNIKRLRSLQNLSQ